MYENDALSFDTRLIGEQIGLKELFSCSTDWEYQKHLSDFLTFTFLIPEGDADYQFRLSHKSFRDYLTALTFVEEINSNTIKHFPKTKATPELRKFILEHPLDQDYLLNLILTAKDLTEETQWQGTNAAEILIRLKRSCLEGQKLANCHLPEVDFMGVYLKDTVFYETNLRGAKFSLPIFQAIIIDADFTDAELDITYSKADNSLEGVEKMQGLKSILCEGNKISDLSPIQNLTNLQKLYCHSNQITDLKPIQNLTNLQKLYCQSNQITDLKPIQNLTNLQELFCDSNQITDLKPIQNLTSLQNLFCDSNQITDLKPIQNLTNLQNLYCNSNEISDLKPIQNLINLQKLSCNSNQVSDLKPIQNLTNLQYLYCHSNQISDLKPIQNLTSLQNLYCHSNQITDLKPIQNLTNLQTLYCGFNQITDLKPIQNLTNLQELFCDSNQITDLKPLHKLTNLKKLWIKNDPISKEEIQSLQKALPNLQIITK